MHHALADGVAANARSGNILDSLEQRRPGDDCVAAGPYAYQVGADPLRAARMGHPELQPAGTSGSASFKGRCSPCAAPAPVRGLRCSCALLDVPLVFFNGSLDSPAHLRHREPLAQTDQGKTRAHRRNVDGDGRRARHRLRCAGGPGSPRMVKEPSRSLVAGVPVVDRAARRRTPVCGQPGLQPLHLARHDIDDPAERLRTISRTTAEAKVVQQTLGRTCSPTGCVHPTGAVLRAHARLLEAWRRLAPPRAVQRDRVQRARPSHPRDDRRSAAGRPLQRRPDPRGHRPQRHRLVLRRPDEPSLLTCPDLLPDVRDIADHAGGAEELRAATP